jgi:hypothetical protein
MIQSSKLSRSALDELDRRFQDELANLERDSQTRAIEEANPVLRARREFEQLRRAYNLTVADVLGFFPEDEAVAYLVKLIELQSAGPDRSANSGPKRSRGT